MSLQREATKVYKEFSAYEGSLHIASEFALYKLLEITHKFKRSSVLEVGLGIGSISGAILGYASKRNKKIDYIGTEANDFCLSQLPLNLKDLYKDLTIYDTVDAVKTLDKKFDLIIIDGKDSHLNNLKNKCTENAILVVEGDRKDQVDELKTLFPKSRFLHAISLKKNSAYGVSDTNDWQGGIKMLFTNPNAAQKHYWLMQKIRTKLIYKLRKFA